jgi:hypothetical protein
MAVFSQLLGFASDWEVVGVVVLVNFLSHAAKWPRRGVATFAEGARESQDLEGSRPDAILTL